ncbi:similar to Saccharomyces cerevisiae YGR096W TPC1 Mitochondrial membrane transporter that mediates uptake of the essential cofactor thiamine pyrophosphate (ThPP) into mitochondria [Maudiozyma barnettii]|uniref:Similar to Saccharomyces cerevisiae YGR096W TPC1 Mitochondrial membrane transporter that mediates uptake of the essential cofactor thiamine pyrophosphate (ThPP) into mitochondria n=1 Tax=Maudiozyma barnettii TaxID=61262 RepID=A0A8H2VAW3_9SACH|nr:thiamine transporter TPC1 [Kazachstania barnettii]CAB4251892.1 similar to Saccharomyces cerevisiae YGR096W TPC1 Mitochondrial membrane transporter that mediates uptake of the essential cofactor thiamine pyrophosphate (ThPP) into mitochondria [Kazachstania barnettii]CAD1778205.1 similar to Saccharomyces cerevisiae YGR096W TPC1 Mitochondrial membrane transporter that mediates uptake of the essential cofactor thiamine pyrophosphate (ThPP) into mitochondria [Kazachstania barnettii]
MKDGDHESDVVLQSPDYLRKGQDAQLLKSSIAGALAGLAARNVIAPLDTLKIRLQITPILKSGSVHNITNPFQLGPSLVGQVHKMIRDEGIRSFWKGNVSGSAMYVIYNGFQFCTYSYFNKHLAPYTGDWLNLHTTLVGALSGVSSSISSYPFDILRTRSIANNQIKLFRIRDGIADIWNHEGFRGFYQGSVSAVLSISIGTSIIFGTYEGLKIYSERKLREVSEQGERSEPLLQIFMYKTLNHSASSISGLLSKIVTFPIDTVRRRILLKDSNHLEQFLGSQHPDKGELYQYFTQYKKKRHADKFTLPFVMISKQMLTHEGPKAFYKGLSMALVKTVPSTAVTLWSYETIMRAMN